MNILPGRVPLDLKKQTELSKTKPKHRLLSCLLGFLLLGTVIPLFGCITPVSAPTGLKVPVCADFITIKYDASGNQLWARILDQPDTRYCPVAMNADVYGNVYVTGTKFTVTKNGHRGAYIIVKYDTNGKQLWLTSYDNSVPICCNMAQAAAVDEAGNVYVTGSSPGSSGTTEVVTVKYSSSGRQLYAAHYQRPGSKFNSASAIAVDKPGNVYITGSAYMGSPGVDDYLTLKYDGKGNLLWAATYDGPAHGSDYAYKIAVDGSGNTYVTGRSSQDAGSNIDYATIKYDASGKELWVACYNGPGNRFDVPHDMELDPWGNVVVTGESDGLNNKREYATVKYSSNGQELWVARYSPPEGIVAVPAAVPSAMSIDGEGNIYVTGEGGNYPNGSSYDTVKYDSNGTQLWVVRYQGLRAGLLKAPSALSVDDVGNTYVTGCAPQPDRSHGTYDTIKYDRNGIQVWVAQYSGLYFGDMPVGVTVDADGNVVIAGPISRFIE